MELVESKKHRVRGKYKNMELVESKKHGARGNIKTWS